jgi:hypothetical protein
MQRLMSGVFNSIEISNRLIGKAALIALKVEANLKLPALLEEGADQLAASRYLET